MDDGDDADDDADGDGVTHDDVTYAAEYYYCYDGNVDVNEYTYDHDDAADDGVDDDE